MIQSQLNNCSIWEFSSEIKKFELKVTGNICAAKYLQQHVFMILFRLLFFTASNTFNSLLSYCPSWAATAKEISTPVYFLFTCECRSTVYTEWCPDWCWPSEGLADHSHSSRSCLGWPEPSAGHSLPSATSPSAPHQSPNSPWMWKISCPASSMREKII